jgi:hypothetical protein
MLHTRAEVLPRPFSRLVASPTEPLRRHTWCSYTSAIRYGCSFWLESSWFGARSSIFRLPACGICFRISIFFPVEIGSYVMKCAVPIWSPPFSRIYKYNYTQEHHMTVSELTLWIVTGMGSVRSNWFTLSLVVQSSCCCSYASSFTATNDTKCRV